MEIDNSVTGLLERIADCDSLIELAFTSGFAMGKLSQMNVAGEITDDEFEKCHQMVKAEREKHRLMQEPSFSEGTGHLMKRYFARMKL